MIPFFQKSPIYFKGRLIVSLKIHPFLGAEYCVSEYDTVQLRVMMQCISVQCNELYAVLSAMRWNEMYAVLKVQSFALYVVLSAMYCTVYSAQCNLMHYIYIAI